MDTAHPARDVESRISRLTSWAVSNGASLHPCVEVVNSPETSLSFHVKTSPATSTLQAWDTVVSIPASLSLSYLNAVQSKPNSGEDDAWRAEIAATQLSPHIVGRLVLIREHLKGPQSLWYPYIQALPSPRDTFSWALPAFWPDEERELLDGTNLEVGIQKIRDDVKSEMRAVEQLLRSGKVKDKLLEEGFSKTLYHWAYCVYSSRSFRPSLVLSEQTLTEVLPSGVKADDFSILLPLFDVGNHDMRTEVKWTLLHSSQERQQSEANKTLASFVSLQVGRDYVAGDQVFNNYSMKTNAELLLGYGFTIDADLPELHNDYIHVRKRATDGSVDDGSNSRGAGEYLISAQPLQHRSSLLGRSRLSARDLRIVDGEAVLPAFQHVSPDMAWDIFCALVPSVSDRRGMLSSEHGPATSSKREVDEMDPAEEHRLMTRLLTGKAETAEGQALVEQTIAVIQHKVMQELERFLETDVEVAGGEAGDLGRNVELALEYRQRCKRVLETVLESMGTQVDGLS